MHIDWRRKTSLASSQWDIKNFKKALDQIGIPTYIGRITKLAGRVVFLFVPWDLKRASSAWVILQSHLAVFKQRVRARGISC